MKKSSFVEGSVVSTLGIFITKILGMLYVIPFYQMIGAKGAALYAYAYNIYVLFLDMSTSGLPIAISKIIKEYNTLDMKDASFRAYRIANKIISCASIIVFLLLFIFARELATLIIGDLKGGNTIADVTIVVRCVSFAILVVPFLSISKGYLEGHNIMNVPAASQVIEQVLRIAFILVGSFLGTRVFNLSLTTTVGVAVFGAFIGAFGASSYVFVKMFRHKKELGLYNQDKKDSISNKDILKKIITYAIPFIIVDVAVSVYSFVDMVLISRTYGALGIDAARTEFITSSVVTWAGKIGMIINAVAMGLTISLIPNIVEAYTLKKWDLVESRLNKALQIVLVSCIPMVVGLILLAKPVWSIFYGNDNLALGTLVLSMYVLSPLAFCVYMVTSSTLQSLNRFKYVYITSLGGYLVNALLDIPLMLLCNKLGLEPCLGAIIASVLGYAFSFSSALIVMNKDHKLKYYDSLKVLVKLVIPTALMGLIVFGLRYIIPIQYDNTISRLVFVSVSTLLGALVYLYCIYKNGVLDHVFGKDYVNRIVSKLTFGKVKLYK